MSGQVLTEVGASLEVIVNKRANISLILSGGAQVTVDRWIPDFEAWEEIEVFTKDKRDFIYGAYNTTYRLRLSNPGSAQVAVW